MTHGTEHLELKIKEIKGEATPQLPQQNSFSFFLFPCFSLFYFIGLVWFWDFLLNFVLFWGDIARAGTDVGGWEEGQDPDT